MQRFLLILPLTIIITLTPGKAQQADTTQATDSLSVPLVAWTTRLISQIQDAPEPFYLYLPWDEWGHSDLAAAVTNPFVPVDLRVGTAHLDGSLGHPILSAIIPSSVAGEGWTSEQGEASSEEPAFLPTSDALAFRIMPMQDPTRSNQTYFFWDQGDYLYRDVQVGGAVQLDEQRNIMTTGESRSHPGPYRLSGPSISGNENSALQNYMLNYLRKAGRSTYLEYTIQHQRELVGLPFVESGLPVADRRRNQTWAHGLHFTKTLTNSTVRLHGATMVSDLRTTTDEVEEEHLNRRSLTFWAGGEVTYLLAPQFHVIGVWDRKGRRITDHALGYQTLNTDHGRLGLNWARKGLSLGGGLALVDGRFAPEGWLIIGSQRRSIILRSEAISFLDYPHESRRLTLDTTAWKGEPVYLSRHSLALESNGARARLTAKVVSLTTDDDRTAATAGLALDWTPWADTFRLFGSITGVSSPDEHLFPTRINAVGGFTFTLPLRNRRARPFVSANAAYIANDFAYWLDPRFADMVSFIDPVSDTKSTAFRINGEVGLKVAGFELRYQMYNMFAATIQNSPYYLPQPGFTASQLRHYSLSWRFQPQK
ncbi:MAG: hypothetical protein JSW54_12765 [Fidelibacterota bacterium]|nr:MAG: hypothetical protein JSW54_12765 [Candidatus Neomarinimicrobiota bacterium]